MGSTGENAMDMQNQNGHNYDTHSECGNSVNKDASSDDFRLVSRNNRKRRNDQNDYEALSNSTHTPKRKNTEETKGLSNEKSNIQGKTTTSIKSYFNNNRLSNKQTDESSIQQQQLYQLNINNRKQNQRDSFPPFRIAIKDDKYPVKDVTIIKEINKKCNLNLTYGRMSTSKTNRGFLLYCNTSTQFEYLLDKPNWPDKLCDCDYLLDLTQKIPSCYSIVMSNVPTQWDVESFTDELKVQYKTIVKSERLYVRGGRPIPKIRIDFSSNKELTEILKHKRMLLDDEHTSYQIEPYVPPPKILRCFICQQYNDHIAAHCPNKDKPICFKCGQQHQYNPECSNQICCAHCKGDHMAGNPNCPKKIEARDSKKLQTKPLPTTNQLRTGKSWAGNSISFPYPIGNLTTSVPVNINPNENNQLLKLVDTINSNVQSILQQKLNLNNHLNELAAQLNNQAKEVININEVLLDKICPLLKEVTQILYIQTNSQQKRQIDPVYNKLINYLNQKDLNRSLVNVSFSTSSPTLQQGRSDGTVLSNNINTNINHESKC